MFYFTGWLLKQFTSSPVLYIFVLNLLAVGILVVGYTKLVYDELRNYSPLAVYLFLCTSSAFLLYGNVVQQGLAISFVLLAMGYAYKRNMVVAYMLLLLAVFTHKSSILFLLFFPIVFSKHIKMSHLIAAFLASLVLMNVDLANIFLSFNWPFITEKLIIYRESEQSNLGLKIGLIMINVALFLYVYNHKTSEVFNLILRFYLIYACIVFLMLDFPKLCSRLIIYMNVLLPILYMNTLSVVRPKWLILLIILCMSFAYGVYVVSHPSIQSIIRGHQILDIFL